MTKEEAKQWIESIKRKYIHGGDEEFDYKRKTALDMAIKALEQESKTRWIPVSERLPEKYTYTLWCASSGYVRSDYFNGEFWEDAKKLGYEVIAWMPLPEPYKPEGDKHDKI